MSLDPLLLRGATAAIYEAGLHGVIGNEDAARADAESAIRMLRCALDTDQAQRDLVKRLVDGTEPMLSHDRDTRPSDDGEQRA